MKVTTLGKPPTDPRGRVLAIEAAMKAICQADGEDAADGVMALLTAAVHLHMQQSGQTVKDAAPHMAHALGCAIVAADDFFKLRTV